MDKLTNERATTFDYLSRYTGVSYFYDTKHNRDIFGIGSQISFDTPYLLHKVEVGDNLDKLALKYYNNPSYWWVLAYFNKINDAFSNIDKTYTTLKIPTISSIVFKD